MFSTFKAIDFLSSSFSVWFRDCCSDWF